MDKICRYGWKIVEVDENMIDKCMNPQYWWTHSIDEPTIYDVFNVVKGVKFGGMKSANTYEICHNTMEWKISHLME
jgi:hypothetical protein